MNTVRSFIRTHQRTLAVCFALLLCAGLLLSGGRAEAASVLRLPAGLKTIEASAFENDKSLDEVILPDGLERIESKAFAGSSVLWLRVPASVQYIAPDAFEGAENLGYVEAPEGSCAYNYFQSTRRITKGAALVYVITESPFQVGYSYDFRRDVIPSTEPATITLSDNLAWTEDGRLWVLDTGDATVTFADTQGNVQTWTGEVLDVFQLAPKGTRYLINPSSETAYFVYMSDVNGSPDPGLYRRPAGGSTEGVGGKPVTAEEDTLLVRAAGLGDVQIELADGGEWITLNSQVLHTASTNRAPMSQIFTAAENTARSPRTGHIRFTLGKYEYVYEVHQEAGHSPLDWFTFVDNGDGTCTLTKYVGTAAEGEEIVIPSENADGLTVTAVGRNAFRGKTDVQSVYLPDSVRTIDEYAFANSGLQHIRLSSGLTSISDGAFYGVSGLTAEVEAGTWAAEWWAANQAGFLPKPEFTAQPTPQEVPAGETVTFTAAAENADAIRWQVDRGDGKGFVDLKESSVWHNVHTDTLSFTAIAAREPYTFRAVAANRAGETPSDPVQFTIIYPPEIVTQPVHQEVPAGETVTFTVAAENADSIRWQVDRGDEKGFVDLKESAVWHNVKTDTLTFTAIAARELYAFRAVAKNRAGETPSDPVQFTIIYPPEIVTQPVHQEVPAGETVTFTVAAENADSIRWQVDRGDEKGFVDLKESAVWHNVKTDTLTFTASTTRELYTFRAVAKNRAGETPSDPVQFTIIYPPEIVTQPVHQEVPAGETVTFTVAAENADSIRWQVDRGDEKGFVDLKESAVWHNVKTDTLTFTASTTRELYAFRAVAKNQAGETPSDPVQFTILYPPEIVLQPVHQEVPVGETVTFTAAAKNADSIRWQVDRGDEKGFVDLKESAVWHNVKTDTLTFTASTARELYTFRAVAKNQAGETPSDPVQFTIIYPPEIVTQPTHQYVPNKETVTFTVAVENADSIRWQVDRGDGKSFVDLAENTAWQGTRTDTLTFTAIAAREPYVFRAVAANRAGEAPSNPVQFTITYQPVIGSVSAAGAVISLDWNAISGAEQYAVYYGTAASGEDAVRLTADKNDCELTNLEYNTIYYLWVAAVYPSGTESGRSEPRSAMTGPAAVRVTGWTADGNSVALHWDRVAGAAGYTVQYHLANTDDPLETVSLGDVTGATISGLLFETEYDVWVFAANSTTLSEPAALTVTTGPEPQVSDFTFEDNGDGTCTLTGYTGEGAADLVIPDTWDGKPVTVIGLGAFQNQSRLTGSLVIPSGVRSIKEFAFGWCTGLTSLTIPDTVTEIGEFAFTNCIGLTGGLTIPGSVKFISRGAFMNCESLTGPLTLQRGITGIGSSAFNFCSSLTGTLTIPDTVTEIGYAAFSDCGGLSGSLVIPSSVTYLGGVAFGGCSGLTGTLTIPASLTDIPDYAFSGCSGFTALVLPDGLLTIGTGAFENCSGLTGTLFLPDSLTYIADDALNGMGDAQVTATQGTYAYDWAVRNGYIIEQWESSPVEWFVFKANGDGKTCTLTGFKNAYATAQLNPDGIVLPSYWGDLKVTEIGAQAFLQCSAFKGRLIIPNTVTKIDYKAFDGCSGFSGSLVIPNSVKEIGEWAFSGCTGFSSLKISNSVTTIKRGTFRKCSGFKGDLIIPDSVKTIGDEAFYYCNGFTGTLTLPENITQIGNSAFAGCRRFTGALKLPESITMIGESAFDGCSKFTGNLVIPYGITKLSSRSFMSCSGFSGDLIIPDSITTIGSDAFYGCTGFKGHLVIPNSVTTIGGGAFEKTCFTGNLIIPDSVTNIGVRAFSECIGFSGDLIIPQSVTTIRGSAFEDCSGFDGKLIIPESVTIIENYTFADCTNLSGELILPSSITQIGLGAFQNCSGFSGNLIIPNNVTSIGYKAFDGCSGFSGNLMIPGSITSIAEYAFQNTNFSDIYCEKTGAAWEYFSGIPEFNNKLHEWDGVTLPYDTTPAERILSVDYVGAESGLGHLVPYACKNGQWSILPTIENARVTIQATTPQVDLYTRCNDDKDYIYLRTLTHSNTSMADDGSIIYNFIEEIDASGMDRYHQSNIYNCFSSYCITPASGNHDILYNGEIMRKGYTTCHIRFYDFDHHNSEKLTYRVPEWRVELYHFVNTGSIFPDSTRKISVLTDVIEGYMIVNDIGAKYFSFIETNANGSKLLLIKPEALYFSDTTFANMTAWKMEITKKSNDYEMKVSLKAKDDDPTFRPAAGAYSLVYNKTDESGAVIYALLDYFTYDGSDNFSRTFKLIKDKKMDIEYNRNYYFMVVQSDKLTADIVLEGDYTYVYKFERENPYDEEAYYTHLHEYMQQGLNPLEDENLADFLIRRLCSYSMDYEDAKTLIDKLKTAPALYRNLYLESVADYTFDLYKDSYFPFLKPAAAYESFGKVTMMSYYFYKSNGKGVGANVTFFHESGHAVDYEGNINPHSDHQLFEYLKQDLRNKLKPWIINLDYSELEAEIILDFLVSGTQEYEVNPVRLHVDELIMFINLHRTNKPQMTREDYNLLREVIYSRLIDDYKRADGNNFLNALMITDISDGFTNNKIYSMVNGEKSFLPGHYNALIGNVEIVTGNPYWYIYGLPTDKMCAEAWAEWFACCIADNMEVMRMNRSYYPRATAYMHIQASEMLKYYIAKHANLDVNRITIDQFTGGYTYK